MIKILSKFKAKIRETGEVYRIVYLNVTGEADLFGNDVEVLLDNGSTEMYSFDEVDLIIEGRWKCGS